MAPEEELGDVGRFVWLGHERSEDDLRRRGLELLIVAPHPDDEVIGPGGRARLAAGKGVGAIVVTDGARGAAGRSEPGLPARREEESLAGMKVVGAAFVWFLRLESLDVQKEPAGAAADAIARAIARFRPRTVVTTSPYERHQTHLATLRATLAAIRRAGPPPRLEGFPVWDPIPGSLGVTELDVGGVLEEKLAAIRCHASQIADRPFDRVARAQMERDGTLAELTGVGGARYVERYVDLAELARAGGPTLRAWLARRFEADADERLGAGRLD
jgi:LmbE family N-acetylglucosaminyl deacetylase